MKPNPLSHPKFEWWWEPIARRYLDQPFSTSEAVKLSCYSRSYTAELLRRQPSAIERVDGSPAMWRFTREALEVATDRIGGTPMSDFKRDTLRDLDRDLLRFAATVNDPGIPVEHCFQTDEMRAMSDADFVQLVLPDILRVCRLVGGEEDDLDLAQLRYANELRRRLARAAGNGGA